MKKQNKKPKKRKDVKRVSKKEKQAPVNDIRRENVRNLYGDNTK